MGDYEHTEAQLVVILDTEPIDRAIFQFSHGLLHELIDACKQRNVDVAMTDVQVREVQAHVQEQIRQVGNLVTSLQARDAANKSIRKHSDNTKDGGVPLPRVLKHHIVQMALAEVTNSASRILSVFEEHVASDKIRVIKSGHVSAERLTRSYFAKEPPFGLGKRKDEFPDAISIEAVRDFAARNDQAGILVVTGDQDWHGAFKIDPGVQVVDDIVVALQRVRDLENIAQSVTKLIVSCDTHLNEQIAESFRELDFSLAGDWSADVEDVSVSNTKVLSVDVLAFHERQASVQFVASVSFSAAARYPSDSYTEWNQAHETAHMRSNVAVSGTADLILSSDLQSLDDVCHLLLAGPVEIEFADAYKISRKSYDSDPE